MQMQTDERKAADAAAREPGFWPNYQEPTPLARAIERPLASPGWQTGVLNAYTQTRKTKHD